LVKIRPAFKEKWKTWSLNFNITTLVQIPDTPAHQHSKKPIDKQIKSVKR